MPEPTPSRRYALIAPCRNEAAYMRTTLDALAAQSVPPSLLVVVDDGSTDDTPHILEEYKARMPYLRVVTRPDRGKRAVGPGVIEAFYAGYQTVNPREFDYVCKIDLDLDLPPRYFEILIQRMEGDSRLGTCSGKPYFKHPESGTLVSEFCGDETSVGMTKFYRVPCFEDIGGFVREVMWDGIDCHTCRMRGWIAASWDEPELRFVHLRPMGSSQQSIWVGRQRHGFGQWFMGTSLAYMTASALYRLPKHPLFVGGLAMWWGFVKSMLARKPRYENPAFRSFLRRWQWESLFLGKARATRRAWERGASERGAKPGGMP